MPGQSGSFSHSKIGFSCFAGFGDFKPLELKMFEREINRKLDEKKTEFIAQSKSIWPRVSEIQELEAKIDTLKSEISSAESFRNQIQKNTM